MIFISMPSPLGMFNWSCDLSSFLMIIKLFYRSNSTLPLIPQWGFHHHIIPQWGLHHHVIPQWGFHHHIIPQWGFHHHYHQVYSSYMETKFHLGWRVERREGKREERILTAELEGRNCLSKYLQLGQRITLWR